MNDFDSVAYQAFLDAAAEKYDFTTCQRPDGSYYGTGGTCRKGTETKGVVSKKDKKMADMRAKDLKRRGASGENAGKQVKGGGGDAVAPAPPKSAMTKKDPVANVQKQQKETATLKKQMDKDVTAKAKAGKIKGVSKADVDRIQAKKSGGATMDKASRNEYGKQAKREQQSIKDIKSEMKRNGKTPELEKRLKQTEARASKFERMSKTGVFEK